MLEVGGGKSVWRRCVPMQYVRSRQGKYRVAANAANERQRRWRRDSRRYKEKREGKENRSSGMTEMLLRPRAYNEMKEGSSREPGQLL